jgi:DNA-binding CsgD family transcriptional regulator
MSGGQGNTEIANSLKIAEGTVKNHVPNILSKPGVHDRTCAVLRGIVWCVPAKAGCPMLRAQAPRAKP